MSLLPALSPWLQRAYEHAAAAIAAGHFGHATLVTGPALIGKRLLAEHLARRVLCQSPRADGEACGSCKGCTLFAARAQYEPLETRPDGSPSHPWGHSAHPDLLLVDYRLPQGHTGLDALAAARAHWPGRKLSAIVITGSTIGGHETEAAEHDFHLLIKPVLPNKLRAMIAFKLGMR